MPAEYCSRWLFFGTETVMQLAGMTTVLSTLLAEKKSLFGLFIIGHEVFLFLPQPPTANVPQVHLRLPTLGTSPNKLYFRRLNKISLESYAGDLDEIILRRGLKGEQPPNTVI